MFYLHFYVPKKNLDEVCAALFTAGAGNFKNYQKCAWYTKGRGQFLPLTESNPHIGKRNRLTKVKEYKVEILCQAASIQKVITALKEKHPYEEVAYYVIKIEDF